MFLIIAIIITNLLATSWSHPIQASVVLAEMDNLPVLSVLLLSTDNTLKDKHWSPGIPEQKIYK